jgi:hypothetical protein
MKYMLEHADQKVKIGTENKEKSKKFNIESISSVWLKIYTKQIR